MKKYVLKIEEDYFIGFGEDIMKKLNLKSGDEVEVLCSPHHLFVEKCFSVCLVCGERENLNEMGNDVFMCNMCLKSLNKVIKQTEKEK